MVLLIGIVLALVCLLGVVMVSATRYLLAHPDEPVHQHGDGGWSSTTDSVDTAASAGPSQAPAPLPAPRTAPVGAYDVPLDDMPADVLAEVAERIRNQKA